MQKVKLLENIEPFCDLWYKTCFYHALFPVIRYFQKSLEPIFFSEMYRYCLEKKDEISLLKMESITEKDRRLIVEELGVSVIYKGFSNDLVPDLIKALQMNRPVIIYIDCFYEPLRQDTYKVRHLVHALLVYGYNLNQDIFHIFEHKYANSPLFKETVMSFQDIINCCEGYQAMNLGVNNPAYMEYYIDNQEKRVISEEECIGSFINRMCNNEVMICKSLDHILEYQQFLENIFSGPLPNGGDLLNDLIENINLITVALNVDYYRFTRVWASTLKFIELINQIIKQWNFVRAMLLKNKLMSKPYPKYTSDVLKKIAEIYLLEKQRHELEFDNLNKMKAAFSIK